MRQGIVAAVVLHALTRIPIYAAGYVSRTRGAGARTPQQRLAETIFAFTRAASDVLFIPHANLLVGDPSEEDSTDLPFFEASLQDVPVGMPLLILARTYRRVHPALLPSFPSTFSVKCASDARCTDFWSQIVKACLDKFSVKRRKCLRMPVNQAAPQAAVLMFNCGWRP